MQQTIFDRKLDFFKNKRNGSNANVNSRPPNWWTPVWRGLIADPEGKHRKAMGSALWIYVYLLSYANRRTGVVRRSLRLMVHDTGYPIRTIQLNLQKLRLRGYVTAEHEGRYLKIQIEKWKAFSDPKWHVKAAEK